MDSFKIDRKMSEMVTGDIVIYQNREATIDSFKIDRKISEIVTGDIAIS